jgi:hypothetical protein
MAYGSLSGHINECPRQTRIYRIPKHPIEHPITTQAKEMPRSEFPIIDCVIPAAVLITTRLSTNPVNTHWPMPLAEFNASERNNPGEKKRRQALITTSGDQT